MNDKVSGSSELLDLVISVVLLFLIRMLINLSGLKAAVSSQTAGSVMNFLRFDWTRQSRGRT